MSDYISKSALKKYLRDYKWEFSLGSDFSKAIEMVDVQPTVDEKEIIRKPMERIKAIFKERAEKYLGEAKMQKHNRFYNIASRYESRAYFYLEAMEVVDEECGINE